MTPPIPDPFLTAERLHLATVPWDEGVYFVVNRVVDVLDQSKTPHVKVRAAATPRSEGSYWAAEVRNTTDAIDASPAAEGVGPTPARALQELVAACARIAREKRAAIDAALDPIGGAP